MKKKAGGGNVGKKKEKGRLGDEVWQRKRKRKTD
jgi:hypothetical protein